MKKEKLFVVVWVMSALLSSVYAWQNPMNMDGQKAVGVGDPYIFKFRGIFYLYSSSRDRQVICWKSKDLVDWSSAIVCLDSDDAYNSYAPEVVYWNGKFYLYSSPRGEGHKVFCADSPEGPFTLVNGDVERKIDGSVFIDDDGKFYFYYADGSGILACPMTSPTDFEDKVIHLNAQVGNNWTEAPCVFKRNDVYYLMYSGNHVYSNAYRIDYASNDQGPIEPYMPAVKQNPVLINTEGSFVGLAHGTAFIGPDLDTYYFTYHNLDRTSGTPYARHFNYDRMAWNGDKLLILGPTYWVQKNPEMPMAVDWFDSGKISTDWVMPNGGDWSILEDDIFMQGNSDSEYKSLLSTATAQDYTAEFTLKGVKENDEKACVGIVFSYIDEENYGRLSFDCATGLLEVNFKNAGVWGTAQTSEMPKDFDLNVWHSVRIEKCQARYKFFVDGLTRCILDGNVSGGQIGYMTRGGIGHFSYIALNDKVNGSGIFDVYKPIPGSIQAIHYNTGGEGVGYHDLTIGNIGNAGSAYMRHDNVDVSTNAEGGFHITSIQAGEWYKYNINARRRTYYTLGLRYSTTSDNTQLRIYQEEKDLVGTIELPNTQGNWSTHIIEGLNLSVGYQTLKIEAVQGEFELYDMLFREGDSTSVTVSDSFDEAFERGWNYTDGQWSIVNDQANIIGYGKRTIGKTGWSNLTIDCDITYISGMNAGIIFRVNNPSLGGAGDDPQLGTDFLQGYFVGITESGISLGKHNYNWTELKHVPGTYKTNQTYHMRIVTQGINIKVYVDDMTTPKIDYDDPEAFITGKVGFRSHSTHARFDNLVITVGNVSPGSKINQIKGGDDFVALYPNPVRDYLKVRVDAQVKKLSIYNMTGHLVHIQSSDVPINMQNFPAGMYIVKIDTISGSYNMKVIKEADGC